MALVGDLLLADDVVVERCVGGPQAGAIASCLDAARAAGRRVWLSAAILPQVHARLGKPGRQELHRLVAGCQTLATLAGDARALSDADPAACQLMLGMERLGVGARLLMLEAPRYARWPAAITPAAALAVGFAPAPMPFIDLAAQQDRIRAELECRVDAVLRHGHYIMGPEVAELEGRLAAYVGTKHCLGTASGTASLEIALRALGVGRGDEVVTVPFTWISSAEVIALCGARPVFVDIEPAGFTLDPERLEAAITPHTRAIMPVSLFGQLADHTRINAIAARHGIPVIEDGAQSFGATRHERRSCGVSAIGSASFFPSKPLGGYGDGGALFTDDDALAARMRAIRTHGGEQRHHHPHLGTNGRLDTLQAAIVLAKLTVLDDELAARGRSGERYSAALRGLCGVPAVLPGNTHVYAQYTVRVPQRERVVAALTALRIPTAVHYPRCLHEQPVFAALGHKVGDFPECERAAREVLSLPMHAYLEAAQQERVIAGVRAALAAG
jgi:UDP-2-acetamido-2-deoxy-ribo-hexuluronate aminotransferase